MCPHQQQKNKLEANSLLKFIKCRNKITTVTNYDLYIFQYCIITAGSIKQSLKNRNLRTRQGARIRNLLANTSKNANLLVSLLFLARDSI